MPQPPRIGLTMDVKDLSATLAAWDQRVRRPQPAMQALVGAMEQFFDQQFKTEGKAGGEGPWKPLRPVTLALRARAGHGRGGILEDTSLLRASYTKPSPYSYRFVSPTTAERGSLLPYATLHQTGWRARTIFGRRRVKPRSVRVVIRRVIPRKLPPRLVKEWVGVLARYVETGQAPEQRPSGQGAPVSSSRGGA